MKHKSNSNLALEITRNYYNSDDADCFYEEVWGGEDIHIGIYDSPDISIASASKNTIKQMINSLIKSPSKQTRILDIGSGYGGTARSLTSQFGSEIVCLNLSEKENALNRKKNYENGLDHKIQVLDGNFEDIPYPNESFDIVWSSDAILHSPDKEKVFKEVSRVLLPGGEFIFTDPMQTPNCPSDVLKPIYERIHLESLGTVEMYETYASLVQLRKIGFTSFSNHLVNHYRAVKKEIEANRVLLTIKISPEFLDRMILGLDHWIEGGEQGHLEWGILHFQKQK